MSGLKIFELAGVEAINILFSRVNGEILLFK